MDSTPDEENPKKGQKRTWFSKLTEDKKEEIRKKRRETYHIKKYHNTEKNPKELENPKDRCSKKITPYATLSEEKKEHIRRRNREAYYMKKKDKVNIFSQNNAYAGVLESCSSDIRQPGICIRDFDLTGNRDSHSEVLSNKGKSAMSGHSSFEIGSTSQQDPVTHGCARKRKHPGVDYNSTSFPNNIFRTTVPQAPDILPSPGLCQYCGAKLFYHESQNLCCNDGKISLISNDVPAELYDLYISTSEQNIEFHKYVRTYNNMFAFTSFGVKYDKSLCRRNKGIYTFRVQGQVYHFINDLLPYDNNPSYLQLYFYDTDHELQHRLDISQRLNISILNQLIDILHVNPYSCFFRSLKDTPNLEDHEVVIRSDARLDQRVFNAPTAPQVAAIWIQNDEAADLRERDIRIFNHSGHSQKVKYYYGCYDPLQYPLLFPYGETGWHEGIKKINRNKGDIFCKDDLIDITHRLLTSEDLVRQEEIVREKKKQRNSVSCREYYSYKLQIRPHEKSILIHSRRLLQQYGVDMYVKLESSRLDYFRNKQAEIRADIYQGIVDSIAVGENRGSKVGKKIVLPSSFIGGSRDMRRRYTDAMALVQRFGKPDFFFNDNL